MSDEGDNNFVRYLYTGEDGEHIPFGATHITVHEDVTIIREAFWRYREVVEVICHDKVERIEQHAFVDCALLKRVIMPGVTIVEEEAFAGCYALTEVDCSKLEIVGDGAFVYYTAHL